MPPTLNNDPNFIAPITNPFGLTDVGSNAAPTFADIDGDGDLDAFVGNQAGNTVFYRNTATAAAPTFTLEATNPFGLTNVVGLAKATLADIDNDGDLDAFVGNKDGNTVFYRNTGTAAAPTFTLEATNPFGLTDVGLSAAPTFADIDGDGDLDAFVGNRYGNTLFFENGPTTPVNNAPTGSPTATLGNTAEDTAIIINAADLLAGFSDVDAGDTLSVANLTADNGTLVDNLDGTYSFTPTADFNGTVTLSYGVTDGTDTLAGQTQTFSVTAVNDAPIKTVPNFITPIINPFGLTTVGYLSAPTFADIDNDGDLDAFVGNAFGNTLFFRNTGTASAPTFTSETTNFGLTDVGYYFTKPTFADIDNDGDLDAFVGNIVDGDVNTQEDGEILFFRNTGTASAPTFTQEATNPFGLTNVGYLATPTFADIDGDGDLDAFVGEFKGNTLFFENQRTATTAEDTAIIINAADLLADFSDVEGDTLSVTGLTTDNGTLVDNGDGTYTFTPTADFNGTVTLTYGVSDGTDTLSGQTLRVDVTPVNDTPVGSPTATLSNTAEDTAININAADLLAGFSDVDGDTLSVTGLTADNGGLVDNGDGTYIFTPTADFNGTVTLDYGVTDGTDTLTGQTQTFSVTAVNDAPVGSPTATLSNTAEDTAITINAADLLAGFSDVDGDTLSVVGLTANNGALVNNNNGTYTFTPTANFNGAVNLSYGVSDGTDTLTGQTRSFSVTAVNDIATITGTATAAVTEDVATILTATGSLTVNDVDTNESVFNTNVTSAGNLGSLSITQNGAYSYSVANSAVQYLGAGQTKTETFTVQSVDGTTSKNIVVTINGVNDAPTGSPTATLSNTAEDTAITITAANLLAGFSDVDAANTLSVVNLTATNGALVNNNNGIYTFTPTLNFNGAVNLTYGVSDGTVTLAGQTRSFSVTPVNDAPVGVNDSATTALNTAVTIQTSTLLANDTDVDSTFRSITGVSGFSNGTAVLKNNGTVSNTADDYIVFTPTTGFSGNASFNYTLSDGSLTGTAAVTVAVGRNIEGTNKADYLVGTNGDDTIEGDNGNDTIYGGAGNDTIKGDNGNDLLYGEAGNDIIEGDNGNDTLFGGVGIDCLHGGNGNDLLYGGLGSDFLTGDNGNDIFAFAAGEGTDTITDFNKGNDKIGLYGGLSFGQLSFSGSNIRVTSTSEILATLTGINTTTLSAADFINI